MHWQPIETAPKDEKRVLLFGPDGVDIGLFIDWCAEPHWRRDMTAEYDNEMAGISTPTHWMPLPPPPGSDDEFIVIPREHME